MTYLNNPHNYCNKFPEDFRVGQERPGEWFLWVKTPKDQRDPDIEGEQFDPIIQLPDDLCAVLLNGQLDTLRDLLVCVLNDGYSIGHDQGQDKKAWDIAAALNLKGDVI